MRDAFRLVVMGAAAVGKTALVHRFLYDAFPCNYAPTVEELYRGEFALLGGSRTSTLRLDILDTSGSYQFPAMRQLAVDTGDAFVLVYAIDDEDSFEEVARLRTMLEGRPLVVVGNKCDLERRRAVRRELADTLVGIDWENRFVEASAKENLGVIDVFREILMQADFPCDPQQRRTSLPPQPINNCKTRNRKNKRNSCAVS